MELRVDDEQFFARLSHRFLRLAVEDKAPWLHPQEQMGLPYNPYSNVNYKGLNGILLDSVAKEKGYADSRWLSPQDIADINKARTEAAARDGTTPKLVKVRYKEEPTVIASQNRYVEPTDINSLTGKKVPAAKSVSLRYYFVYNAEQLSGLPEKSKELEVSAFVKEKRATALENLSASTYAEALGKLKQVRPPHSIQAATFVSAIAEYSLCMETQEPYKPSYSKESIAQELKKVRQQDKNWSKSLLSDIDAGSKITQRCVRPGMQLVVENRRTTERDSSRER